MTGDAPQAGARGGGEGKRRPEAGPVRSGPGWIPVGNDRGQASVWRAGRPPPAGWHALGEACDRTAALDVAAAWMGGVRPGPGEPGPASTVDGRFLAAVQRCRSNVAVTDRSGEFSYGELSGLAAAVRAGLRRLGVRRGDTVGVCLNRDARMIAVVLGVLSAGAAYVPLDGWYPAARLQFMAEDADIACAVADPAFAAALSGIAVPVVAYEDLVAAHLEPEEPGGAAGPATCPGDLAYVIYTSGSTGRPKGVEVSHRSLAAFLDAMTAVLPPAAPDRALFSTRLSFDIAALEMFLPLTSGGMCLVAPETRLPSPSAVATMINTFRPSLVQATPAAWRLLLDRGAAFGAGQTILCGGDVLPPGLASRLAALPAAAFNMYGPTEATVWATAWPIGTSGPLIGRALGHAHVYVLGDDGAPVAPGEYGEAYIGGPAVAVGYRGMPRLTADRFVPDPWPEQPGTRIYATGDIVRVVGGELQFGHRRDTQVKINGNRVELGEVESLACEVEGVRAAVALVVAAEAIHLYLESAGDAAALSQAAHAHLRLFAPAGMLPQQITVLSALPVTPNGKVDRAQLESWSRDEATGSRR
jgi:amino acid adenylation domain-containing protein